MAGIIARLTTTKPEPHQPRRDLSDTNTPRRLVHS